MIKHKIMELTAKAVPKLIISLYIQTGAPQAAKFCKRQAIPPSLGATRQRGAEFSLSSFLSETS